MRDGKVVLVAVITLGVLAAWFPLRGPAQGRSSSTTGACLTEPKNATVVQRGELRFKSYGCQVCHGVKLQMPPGAGRMDLMHAKEVGVDIDGNVIGTMVRYGLPNAQDQMPAYGAGVSDRDIKDLAAFVHAARQDGRYAELTGDRAAGDAGKGKLLFDGKGKCVSCHATKSLSAALGNRTAMEIRKVLLRPNFSDAAKESAGRLAHQQILETYSLEEIRDLTAYVAAVK